MANIIIIASATVSIIVALLNCVVLITIKFNDLHHLGKDIEEIKQNQKEDSKKVDCLSERVAKIEGKLEE